MYSLGIILYEMSHPPLSTVMERVKILADVRKKEVVFSEIFKSSKKSKQVRKRRREGRGKDGCFKLQYFF